MDPITRRDLIGLGILSGPAALLAAGAAGAAPGDAVLVAGEKAVLFKVRDVTLERVDPASRTIAVSLGKGPRPLRLENLPLAEDVNLRVSLVDPGVVNNLPFDWDRLRGFLNQRVSLLLRAGGTTLTVAAIATAND